MGRGEHPERTPLYGALLMAAAFLSVWLASVVGQRWLSVAILVVAVVVGAVGFVMTFRDREP
ncbi:hypothetical protein [Mycolicibacterium palauense]|uniref:hypothetical protein n=1 Tax=Mycolicibacterium palauense TaxID=2034511 RepID=UPI000BFEB8E6|nr:hypothetical protein [Mycolicibacterium palauense]